MAYNCFLIRPSDFIADCCVQVRCKRHNIDWLAVEQSTLSSSEPGCNTQRLRHMIYWKPTDRRIRMTSHPGLRNLADAQDVFAFLYHLIKTEKLAFFILQRIHYWNEIFQYYFKKQQLKLLREVNEIYARFPLISIQRWRKGVVFFLFIHVY